MKNFQRYGFFDEVRLSSAFSNIIYGYFLKVVIADRINVYTDHIFSDYEQYSPLWLVIGSLMYTVQLYCDFAGYSSVAVGVAKIFGIELTHNFLAPYLSKNISDFWRKWHISLSSWLRDYIYIPLGGGKKGTFKRCINVFLVFFVCGIWHGNGFRYIARGILHGLFSIFNILYSKIMTGKRRFYLLEGFITFVCVSIAWVFFAASGTTGAIRYIIKMFSVLTAEPDFLAGMSLLGAGWFDLIVISCSVVCLVIMDIISLRASKPFPEAVLSWKYGYRYMIYYLMIVVLFVLGSYGPEFDARQFMYMDF